MKSRKTKSLKFKIVSSAIISFAISNTAFASVPYSNSLEVQNALRMPLEKRIVYFNSKDHKRKSERELIQIAFDNKQTLQDRWRAVTVLGRAYPNTSRKYMERALRSNEWFMRNAALVVLPYGDKKWAKDWSIRLLDDPALVVRTAAVKVIRQMDAREASSRLWTKLYSPENYRGQSSLWIRRHIVGALRQFAQKGDESQFIGLLRDRDPNLHAEAIQALQKITRQNFRSKNEWANWWENSKKI